VGNSLLLNINREEHLLSLVMELKAVQGEEAAGLEWTFRTRSEYIQDKIFSWYWGCATLLCDTL